MVPNMMAKSPSRFRFPFESPFASPAYTRPNSSREDDKPFGIESRYREDRSNGRADSPPRLTVEFSPPRSTSSADHSDSEVRTDLSTSPERSDHSSRRSERGDRTQGQQEEPVTPIKTLRIPRLGSWRREESRDVAVLPPNDLVRGVATDGVHVSSTGQRSSHATVLEHDGTLGSLGAIPGKDGRIHDDDHLVASDVQYHSSLESRRNDVDQADIG